MEGTIENEFILPELANTATPSPTTIAITVPTIAPTIVTGKTS